MVPMRKATVEVLERPLPKREREQVVEDLNLFAALREQLPSESRQQLRSLLRRWSEVGKVDDAVEIHPATGRPIGSADDRLKTMFKSMLDYFAVRRGLLAEALTAPQVARLLCVSRQTPLNRAQANTLLAVQENGIWRFPAWQFSPEGEHDVIGGLPETLDALEPQDSFAKLVWLTRPSKTLDGRQPVELLRAGERDRVIAAAQAVSALP